MSFEEYVTRIVHLDKMILYKSTGSPKELSQKLNLSESTTYRILNLIKTNKGRETAFDRYLNSYVHITEYPPIDLRKISLSVES